MICIMKNGAIFFDESYVKNTENILFKVNELPNKPTERDGYSIVLKVDFDNKNLYYDYVENPKEEVIKTVDARLNEIEENTEVIAETVDYTLQDIEAIAETVTINAEDLTITADTVNMMLEVIMNQQERIEALENQMNGGNA